MHGVLFRITDFGKDYFYSSGLADTNLINSGRLPVSGNKEE